MTKGLLADRVTAWPADSTEMSIVAGKLSNHYCIDRIDPDATLDWSALDRFPKLYYLTYEGRDATLIKYLAKRKTVTELMWQAPGLTGKYDLSRTHLKTIMMQPTKKLSLVLPRTTTSLSLLQCDGKESIDVKTSALQWLRLQMASERPPKLPRGVEKVVELEVTFAEQVKLANFAACANLQVLALHTEDRLAIKDIQMLARFPKLRRLSIHGAYSLDTAMLPPLPKLERLEVYGTTKAIAAVLRERFAEIDLEIGGIARSNRR